MIKLKEIMKAINETLSIHLQKDVDSYDLSENFARPSIRTNLAKLTPENFMNSYKKREFLIRIYYFPKDIKNNQIELLEIQDTMEEIFLNHIYIRDDFYIYVDDISFEVTDGVLVATLEFLTMEEIIIEDLSEYMEELAVSYTQKDIGIKDFTNENNTNLENLRENLKTELIEKIEINL